MKRIKKYLKIFIAFYLLVCLVLIVLQRLIILHPTTLEQNYKYDFPERFDESFLYPEKNVALNCVYFRATQQLKGVVLYFHGNSDNIQRWGKHAHEFTSRGYDVLFYDFRGFGKSTGRTTEENLLKDAQLVYKNLALQFPENQIILYGRSLGTGIATKIASTNSPKELILESPYYGLQDLWWTYLPIMPYHWVTTFEMPTYQWIPQVKCPIHIFHGTSDRIVLYSQSLKLIQLLKKPEILTTLEGGHHRGLENFPQYQQKMDELLK